MATQVTSPKDTTSKTETKKETQLNRSSDKASPIPSPNTSSENNQLNKISPQSSEEKKSYKAALSKETSDKPQQNSTEDKNKENKAEENTQPTQDNAESTFQAQNQRHPNTKGRGRNYNNMGGNRGSAPWRKNNTNNSNNRRKKRDGDELVESLADPSAWPTLDKTKSPEMKERKAKEGAKSPEPSTTSTTTSTIITTPATSTTGESEEKTENKQNADTNDLSGANGLNKKKGVNWIPFPHELEPSHAPRQYSGRGRGGIGRGGRRDNQTNPDGRPYRNQMGNQNFRGGRRGGRGGYGRGGFNQPGTVYYNVALEGEALAGAVKQQIEYYFSIDNLCKDLYLRGLMDEEGWVLVTDLVNFNRLKSMGADINAITECARVSPAVELQDGKVRKKEDWKTWVLPKPANP